MLSRRDALRGGTASVAAIAAAGAVAGAAVPAAVDGPLLALVAEMNRLGDLQHEIFVRTGDADGNPDPILDEGARRALLRTADEYRDQVTALEGQLVKIPARSPQGVLAKLRAWYGEDEQAAMLADGKPEDPLPEAYVGSIYRDLLRLAREASS